MAYINGNKIPAILRKGDKGDNAFIRYSANADGTDFTEEWSEGQTYIGFATGQTAPTNKNDYEWISLPSGLSDVDLPQEWFDINEAYKEDDHKILGGLIYKDFEGNIKVFPLTPPYGIRTDEVGAEYAQSSVAMYNSAQQLLVKPATDNRHAVPLSQLTEKLGMYLAKTGGTMTGKPEIKLSNPAVKLTDTSDSNSTSYVQAYQGKTAMGYSFAKSITVDKSGNVGVPGSLTVVGNVSCGEAKKDTDAVNVDYLNRRLETFGKPEVSKTPDALGVLKYLEEAFNIKLASKGLSYDDWGDVGSAVSGKGSCTDSDIVIPKNITEGIYAGKRIIAITQYAFLRESITSIVIPNGVSSIEVGAFYDCNLLALINIPDSVMHIDYGAFGDCDELRKVTFYGKPSTIHAEAFHTCPNLRTINVPWAFGEVAGAPWGATSSTIIYNYTEA